MEGSHYQFIKKTIKINWNIVQIKAICKLRNCEKCILCLILFSSGLWHTSVGSACDTLIGSIQVLQKRVVRLITYHDQFPLIPGPLPASSPLFAKLGLLKLKDIFSLQVSIFIHKCLDLQTSDNFNDWYILNHSKHNYLTRHNYNNPSNKVATNSLFPARTSNYGLKKLKVKGPKIWNTLPTIIRTTQSPYSFKKSLKLHFISTY